MADRSHPLADELEQATSSLKAVLRKLPAGAERDSAEAHLATSAMYAQQSVDQYVIALHGELDEHTRTIAQQAEALEAKDRRIAEHQQRVAEHESTLAAQKKQIADLKIKLEAAQEVGAEPMAERARREIAE